MNLTGGKLKCGVVCDNYKVSTMERHFKKHGYEFTRVGPCDDKTTLIEVMTTDPKALAKVIEAANAEAQAVRAPGSRSVQ